MAGDGRMGWWWKEGGIVEWSSTPNKVLCICKINGVEKNGRDHEGAKVVV